MAITGSIYRSALARILNQTLDWSNGTAANFQAQLIAEAHSPQRNTHDYRNDVSANDATGCVPSTITPADAAVATDVVRLDATQTSITFETVSTTLVGGMYTYRSSGNTTQSPLLCLNDLSATVQANGSNIKVTISNGYIVRLSIA